MKPLSRSPIDHAAASSQENTESTLDLDTAPLSLPHRAELWSGRFAMIGFMTIVTAIALT